MIKSINMKDVKYFSLEEINKTKKGNLTQIFVDTYDQVNIPSKYVYNNGKVFNIVFYMKNIGNIKVYYGWLYRTRSIERINNQIDKFNNAGAIVFDGTDYTFDKARNNNVISQLLPIVSNYFTEENGYISAIAGIEDSVMSEYGKAGERANIVLSALKDFEYQFSQEDRDNIVRILTEYSNKKKAINGGAKPKDESAVKAEQMYENPETGERVPKSEWDTYRPSKKELYEPVTA
jgi:hypothetical protein